MEHLQWMQRVTGCGHLGRQYTFAALDAHGVVPHIAEVTQSLPERHPYITECAVRCSGPDGLSEILQRIRLHAERRQTDQV